ncbi:MAG: hypothetical protein U0231_09355 [Nitrospiraceae bacterium]
MKPLPNDWKSGHARGTCELCGCVTLVSSLVVGLVASLLQVSAAYWKLQTAGMMLLVVGTLWAQQVHQHAAGILHGLHREDEETLPASMGIALSGLPSDSARGVGIRRGRSLDRDADGDGIGGGGDVAAGRSCIE